MTAKKLYFISGRTAKQGRFLHLGKNSPQYLEEISTLEMNEIDMQGMDLKDGDEVHVRTSEGEVLARCRRSEALPRGLIFMPYGELVNALISADTGGTGMPDLKVVEVEIWK